MMASRIMEMHFFLCVCMCEEDNGTMCVLGMSCYSATSYF